jgi:hypothetical protein
LSRLVDRSRVCAQEGLEPEELDKRLSGFGWEDLWDNFSGPQAKAFHLLKQLDLGASDSKLRHSGEIIFQEFGGRPGLNYTSVDLKDDLTVSLLQARLIELNLPINVAAEREIETRLWHLFATCRHRPCVAKVRNRPPPSVDRLDG